MYKGEGRQEVLEPRLRDSLLKDRMTKFPLIAEKEIQHCSKGDGLSKTLVIGHTSRFLMRCVVQLAEGLGVTRVGDMRLRCSEWNTLFFWCDSGVPTGYT